MQELIKNNYKFDFTEGGENRRLAITRLLVEKGIRRLEQEILCKGGERMQKKALSLIVIGVGIVILLVSLLADVIGIGKYPGFGYKQAIGTAIGIVIFIIGLIIYRK